MQLPAPVELPARQYTTPNGSVVAVPAMTVSKLILHIFDDVERKFCSVRFAGFPVPLTLWSGADYDAAGDYTQADVENRVLELLGSDPTAALEKLRPAPTFHPRPERAARPARPTT